mmetsp:Transcript_36752/g.119523  ORF Transcript_36752/g.119523 Transcript_36752/m.119523 type:complete len:330 (+) Transcript_36752:350-1339(+)
MWPSWSATPADATIHGTTAGQCSFSALPAPATTWRTLLIRPRARRRVRPWRQRVLAAARAARPAAAAARGKRNCSGALSARITARRPLSSSDSARSSSASPRRPKRIAGAATARTTGATTALSRREPAAAAARSTALTGRQSRRTTARTAALAAGSSRKRTVLAAASSMCHHSAARCDFRASTSTNAPTTDVAARGAGTPKGRSPAAGAARASAAAPPTPSPTRTSSLLALPPGSACSSGLSSTSASVLEIWWPSAASGSATDAPGTCTTASANAVLSAARAASPSRTSAVAAPEDRLAPCSSKPGLGSAPPRKTATPPIPIDAQSFTK